MAGRKVCKDCVTEFGEELARKKARDAKFPGPRCKTHDLRVKRARRAARHGQHVERTFGITHEQYWQLYHAQGGKCALCQRATGVTKKLAVEHDHSCCPNPPTCGKCVRSLACGPCNRFLGYGRDDPEFFERFAEYLRNPPAKEVMKAWSVP